MVQVKDPTGITVGELWSEVKDEEGWWGDLVPGCEKGVTILRSW